MSSVKVLLYSESPKSEQADEPNATSQHLIYAIKQTQQHSSYSWNFALSKTLIHFILHLITKSVEEIYDTHSKQMNPTPPVNI
jgi:hypothetical protein